MRHQVSEKNNISRHKRLIGQIRKTRELFEERAVLLGCDACEAHQQPTQQAIPKGTTVAHMPWR